MFTLKVLKNTLKVESAEVQVQGHRSENLVVGLRSVTQGSVLSCLFYLVFILDMPTMFHESRHTPEEQRQCKRENLKTFVDDNLIKVRQNDHKSMEQAIHSTMATVENYMAANKLQGQY